MSTEKIGGWAFILGLVIAILFGLIGYNPSWAIGLLVVLGLIVGFLNITDKETVPFLVASIALLAAGSANLGELWVNLNGLLGNISVFVAPAAIIVAIKAVYALGAKK